MPDLEKILKKIESGRQFRRNDLHPEFRALDMAANDNQMIVEGHATTFDEEYELYSFDDFNGYRTSVVEVVDRRAFDETDMSDVIFLYDHRGRVMARNRNKTLTIQPDNVGLFIRAYLSGSDLGPGLYADIQKGYVDRMSMQFTVAAHELTEERDDENKTRRLIRRITRVGKLYDVSAVGIPANDGTDISARSAADGVIQAFEAERLLRLNELKRAEALKLSIDISLER
ncbi:MAG: HK97 family phage prohead protease [Solobacterium sp.]|nr:HK97 family phage prohead protease [Solobacterium sp.]